MSDMIDMFRPVSRPEYSEHLIRLKDNGNAKALIGIRRCGKSTILSMVAESDDRNIIYIDLDTWEGRKIGSAEDLMKRIDSSLSKDRDSCLFIDEIQNVDGWEEVIRSLIAERKCDIYLSGSNSRLLSGELATYLTGRTSIINIHTLTLKECLRFEQSIGKTSSEVLARFIRTGGFPTVWRNGYSESESYSSINDLYNMIVKADIIGRHRIRNPDDLDRIFIEPAAVALAEKINAEGLALYKDIPYAVGTAGTTPNSLAAFADARMALNVNKAPATGRVGVWSPEADAKFTQIPALVNAEKSGTVQALREGSIGRVFGIDNYMAQGVKQHESGITASEGVKLSASAAAGATTIGLTGTALTGKLVKGDVLTILGSTYVVTEDTAAASSNAIANVKIYPGLKKAGTTATNVTIAASHSANLVFCPMAFAYVTRPLINPDGQGVQSYVTSLNGISLRVTKGYNQQYKRSMYSMDVLYGYKTIYPELAVRVMG